MSTVFAIWLGLMAVMIVWMVWDYHTKKKELEKLDVRFEDAMSYIERKFVEWSKEKV